MKATADANAQSQKELLDKRKKNRLTKDQVLHLPEKKVLLDLKGKGYIRKKCFDL